MSVQAHASPIPKFEGKDVGCCADLQYHAAAAGAVYCACGNEEMIVLFRRPFVDVSLRVKLHAFVLCGLQIVKHGAWFDVLSEPEIYGGAVFGIEHVVAFILRVFDAEVVPYVTVQGVYLEREISSSDCVEQIKAYGKLRLKRL